MRIIGFLIAVVIIAMGMASGGQLMLFADVPSAIVVLIIPLGCSMMSGVPLLLTLKTALTALPLPEDAARAAQGLRQLRAYVVASGWVGFLIGSITLAVYADDIASLGPAVALSLLTVLYAVILSYVVLLPLQHGLERVGAD